MTHAPANNLLRLLAAVPLAGMSLGPASLAIASLGPASLATASLGPASLATAMLPTPSARDELPTPSARDELPTPSARNSILEAPRMSPQKRDFPAPALSFSEKALAQQITPEENSTGTIVTPTDTEIEITGGRRSPDGSNLFHSFTQFNVEQNQTVNFISKPAIQNILTRVNGGDPSIINGLLRVTGGNSNLFIMNPAGILFGTKARLDVPGSFIATTASGIGFNFGRFDALGNADYETLNGTPTSFFFPTEAVGAIANGGELSVAATENILLVGGQVINIGTVSAPGGQITVAAVPGESIVRISQQGHLLNLELEAGGGEPAATETFNPISLPALLTLGEESLTDVTGITVEGDRVLLTASQRGRGDAETRGRGEVAPPDKSSGSIEIPNEAGTAIVSGSLDVSSAENSLPAPGRIDILGKKIGLFDANINASGAYTAGDVRIGGEYFGIETGFAADRVYIDENAVIEANSFFGEPGRVTIWSQEGTAFFGSIAANGNLPSPDEGDGGNGEVSSETDRFVGVGSRRNLIFDGTISLLRSDGSLGNLLLNSTNFIAIDTEIVPDSNFLGESTAVPSQVSAGALSTLTGSATLTVNATNDIQVSDRLELQNNRGQKVTLKADIDGDGIGSFLMDPGETLSTDGGAIAISGASVTAGNITTSGGDLEITSTVGSISTNNLSTANPRETGGEILLNARGELNAGELNSSGQLQGGNITATSETGSVEIAATIDATSASGRGGNVNLKADVDIESIDIDAGGGNGGGNVNLETSSSLFVGGILTSSNSEENGNITLTGNEIDLNSNEASIVSNGKLRLQPYSPERDLNLGGGENAESLNLTAAELATLADGFSSIIIGRENGSGTITVNRQQGAGITFKDPVTLQSPGESGAIAGGGSITGNASITLNANGGIAVGNVTSPTEININSDRANISTGNLLVTEAGQGGINLEAYGDITTGELTSPSGLNLTSTSGNITTDNIFTRATVGTGGNIDISSKVGFVETGSLDTTGPGGGGNIEIRASDRVAAGRIDASSTLGNGGSVILNAGGDVEAVSIDTGGGVAGRGGNLTVSTGVNFRVTDTLTVTLGTETVAASISTAGGTGPGAIAIQHGAPENCSPGATCGNTAFTVGDATVNGTAGAITDGEYIILPTQTVPNNFDIREAGELLGQNEGDSNGEDRDSDVADAEGQKEEDGSGEAEAETPEEGVEENETEAIAPEPQEEGEAATPNPEETTQTESGSGETGQASQPQSGNGESEAGGNETEAIAPQPQEETSSGESQSAGRQQSDRNLFETAKPTLPETENPAPSPTVANNPQPPSIPTQEAIRDRESEGQQATQNPAPSPTVANNPQPAPVRTENSALPTSVTNNPTVLPQADADTEPQNAQPTADGDPKPEPEVLENTIEPSVLERPTGAERVLNDVELNQTALDNPEPAPPVLENLQPTPPITENPNPVEPVLENPNPVEPALENPELGIAANPSATPPPPLSTAGAGEPPPSLSTAGVGEPPPPFQRGAGGDFPTPDSSALNLTRGESFVPPTIPPREASPNNNSINNQINLTDTATLLQIEQLRGQEFVSYLGGSLPHREATAANIRDSLSSVAKIGIKPAVIYVSARKNSLELQLFLPDGRPIVKSSGRKREEVLEVARDFATKVRTPSSLDTQDYLPGAQKLYDWLIEPLSQHLAANDINMLIFSMDTGLRTIPLAALHDGEQFLVEKYSMGLIPSFSLTDTRYVGLNNAKVLAMGASEFPTDPEQSPLPGVPTELSTIVGELWQGKSFLNEGFTLDNLREQRRKEQFRIIHLATHGEFHPGGTENSYIQFWDEKLGLDRLRQLRLHDPQVELLVLSACTTAVGDEEAELGFAGLAVQAGVKSALASLWYVSDTATLGLMSEFYQRLFAGSVKAEALREAQLAMLRGELHLRDGYLYRGGDRSLPLPQELAAGGNRDLSHPYYWAAFTTIGSPW